MGLFAYWWVFGIECFVAVLRWWFWCFGFGILVIVFLGVFWYWFRFCCFRFVMVVCLRLLWLDGTGFGVLGFGLVMVF